ncbi:zinc-ribbon domain-containing protein [Tenacibaculum sp. IB213877]|uniref:zinc-ribbon domain-containing protein n=1 Tax=Tenacibaculum sp. IB213877 TaxID=3097351 RepID=UPI002A5AF174|nr:zinc-ribbon domain-containing protein [Tenacibaculum sp. IB213877]MDY0780002.1 zinc-ribbon domain-containing protein [Tenacibaculum sp. IB213877]
MIIYGTKGTHLHSEKVSGVKCDHCNQQNTHTISVFGRYFYIYWIPIFPLGKKAVSECNHCKATYERKQMNEQLQLAHDNVKRNTKTPITHWAGSLVIGALIAFGIYSAKQHDNNVVDYINSPQVNDIIDYKSSDNAYSTLKITKVTADSVFVVANSMEIKRKRKLYKIDKEANYNAERFGLSLNEYKEAFDSKRFLDVDR